MILSILSFGVTWVVLAIAFFGLSHVLPGFHSNYSQLVWGAGFRMGFVDALILKGAQLAGVQPLNPLIYVVVIGLNWLLMAIANHPERGFYVDGNIAPLVTATVLTAIAFAVELGKEWYRRKEAQ